MRKPIIFHNIDEQRRIKQLIKLLECNTRNRSAALRELSNYKDNPLAVNAIVYVLGDGNSSSVRKLADSIVMELGEKVSDQIIDLLHNGDRTVRRHVMSSESLVKICSTKAIEPLIDILKHDRDAWIREYSALALGRIGDKRALEPLIEALDDVFHTVRMRAAISLGKLGDVQAIPKLTARLMDEHPDVRSCSACALGKIGDYSSMRPLRLALLRILAQIVEHPEKLLKYQEAKKLKEQKSQERLKKEKRRKYYRELDRFRQLSDGSSN